MPIQLKDSDGNDVIPKEDATVFFVCSFTDEDGNAETPGTAVWSLTDENGTVINSRDQVSISSLDTTVTVTASGNDLQILSGETADYVNRLFLLEWTYDSDHGNNLPGKEVASFCIENLEQVT